METRQARAKAFRSQRWTSEMAQEDAWFATVVLSRGELVTEFGGRQRLRDRFQKWVIVNTSLTV